MLSECDLETDLEYSRNRSAVILLMLIAEKVDFFLLFVPITVDFVNIYRGLEGEMHQIGTMDLWFNF